jgi:ABC-type branched-subunit amino acid transport system permease subunit
MNDQKQNEWIWPPADQWLTVWGHFVMFSTIVLVGELVYLFSSLTAARRIECYFGALTIAITGASLIFFAKLPLYRRRRFFTFGSRPLPEDRRPFYRWGYRCLAFAILVIVCLVVTKW